MKTIIVSLFISLFSITAFSQNLVKEGRKWTVLSYNYPQKEPRCLVTEYVLQGDTTIESVVYKRLFEIVKADQSYQLRGLLREGGGRVYKRYLQEEVTKEGLLYDFGAKEGEEVRIESAYHPYQNNWPIYVDRIEYKNTDRGIIRKITLSTTFRREGFKFPSTIWDCWYDNVGSISGVLLSGEYCCVDAFSLPILISCIDSDGTILFQNNENYANCDGYTSVPDIQPTSEKVKVSYDASSGIEVSLDSSAGLCFFELFNTQGSLVMKQQVSSGVNRLNMNKKGFFFYRVHDNKNVLRTGKLLIK